MKVKFIATYNAPMKYVFDGEKIIVYYQEQIEIFDLSEIEFGDIFFVEKNDIFLHGCQPNILPIEGTFIIRNALRDASGELWVTLCQKASISYWNESDWMPASNYDENTKYIIELEIPPVLFELDIE